MKKIFSALIFSIFSTNALVAQVFEINKNLKFHQENLQKIYQLKDIEKAKVFLKNQQEYMESFFVQSIDPYSGKPQFSSDCLKKNRIGKIEVEGRDRLYFLSDLYLVKDQLGFCPDSSQVRRASILYTYCKNTNEVKKWVLDVEFKTEAFILKGKLNCQ